MAERQRQTRDWWENHRGEYQLFTSETTIEECRLGEAFMARRRVVALAGIPIIPAYSGIAALAEALVARGPLPVKAKTDAFHIAAAAMERIAYLLTWDCRHIANPRMYRRCETICHDYGAELPILCTPDILLRSG
ncbi:MAG TPA: type II toxin-antitoxin system VapC family toxin [Longimicrobium sp.]